MSSTKKKWIKLICLALFAGIGFVQVFYAVLWAVSNGSNVQDFYDTALYLSNAETLTSDGWRLIGYSYVIRFFMLFKSLLGEAYVLLIYFAQVIVSLLCFVKGISTFSKILFDRAIPYFHSLILAIYIITIPIIWQMQFAVLPDSFCLSLIVLLFVKISQCMYDDKSMIWDCLLVIAGTLLLLGVLQRHYFYGALCMCIIEVVILLLRQIIPKYRKPKALISTCIILATVILIPCIVKEANDTVEKDELYATYSLEADLWSRFVYPNLEEDYPFYSERITNIINHYAVEVCGDTYEYYMNSIGPMIEINNPQEASSMYWEMVEKGWDIHESEYKEAICKEMVSYIFMPVAMVKYMYYSGISLYGHNFSKMYEMAPKLTMDYMHISMNGLLVICVMGCILYCISLFEQKGMVCKRIFIFIRSILAIICVTIPLMIFSVERFDYRIGMFSVFVWVGFALVNIYMQRSKGGHCEKEENNE